jgi:hypothetical protein
MNDRVVPPRIAILDDYQNIALAWRTGCRCRLGTEVRAYSAPARDERELVRRLLPYDVVVAMRERTAFAASLIDALRRIAPRDC